MLRKWIIIISALIHPLFLSTKNLNYVLFYFVEKWNILIWWYPRRTYVWCKISLTENKLNRLHWDFPLLIRLLPLPNLSFFSRLVLKIAVEYNFIWNICISSNSNSYWKLCWCQSFIDMQKYIHRWWAGKSEEIPSNSLLFP